MMTEFVLLFHRKGFICNIIVFILNFEQFIAVALNKSINFFFSNSKLLNDSVPQLP